MPRSVSRVWSRNCWNEMAMSVTIRVVRRSDEEVVEDWDWGCVEEFEEEGERWR
jgi:hypothetical protein